MAKIYKNLTELIGRTPLVEVCEIEREDGLKARVLVKLESYDHAVTGNTDDCGDQKLSKTGHCYDTGVLSFPSCGYK